MLSIIISIIACITGCAGLIVSLYRMFLERGKLSIFSKTDENIYFPKVFKGYATNNQAVVSLRLINRSIYPLTVYDISVKADKFEYKPEIINDDKLLIPSSVFGFGNEPVVLGINMTPKLIMPHVLPPFHVYEGTIFFPYFANMDNGKTDITIFVSTSRNRKRLKYNSTIKKLDSAEITSKMVVIDDPAKKD